MRPSPESTHAALPRRAFSLLVPLAFVVVAAFASGCTRESPATGTGAPSSRKILRLGHFPNLTHAQGLIAHHHSRLRAQGKGPGWFEPRLGDDIEIQWSVYNAGPSAMEAIFSGYLDATYVGPSPALNAYTRSGGDEIRVISGSAQGGSALVVQPDGRIQVPADFRGKKVATPQLGNTQDVVCRAWLESHGFEVTIQGGDVHVVPTQNPDQLTGFLQGSLDAVWTVEPWVSRLELEAKGKVFLEEKDSLTTVLVASAKFLETDRALARKLVEAHAELTEWIAAHPEEAQKIVNEEIQEETTRAMPQALIQHAWPRLRFSTEVRREGFEAFVSAARDVGLLPGTVDLSRLLEAP